MKACHRAVLLSENVNILKLHMNMLHMLMPKRARKRANHLTSELQIQTNLIAHSKQFLFNL